MLDSPNYPCQYNSPEVAFEEVIRSVPVVSHNAVYGQ
jgi:hypothetical protein